MPLLLPAQLLEESRCAMPTCSLVRLDDSILVSREDNFRKNSAFLNTVWLSLPNAPLHPPTYDCRITILSLHSHWLK